jgi:protein involved in polysaccharide export with SLBB domain
MRKAFLATLLIFTVLFSYSQQMPAGISMQNIASVNVDQLTDEQINQFWTQAQAGGMNLAKIEQYALQRKMPQTEINKLKGRIEKLASAGAVNVTVEQGERAYNVEKGNVVEAKDVNSAFSNLKPKVFGADLFNNKNLTFEPNLKMSTPQDYQLGPDDELIIDVYGSSESTLKLKISTEGSIRIPLIGPISVAGLTIEQSKKRIVNQLSTIYSGIAKGETFVNVTLGNIRSIKVTILGEVNTPGTYTLSSLSTVFNGLYVSGGPSENGSFRKIQLIRNNKVETTVDMYDFLMNGTTKSNIRLQDQDIIKVSPFEKRIEIKGEVKRPGLFEALKGETLKNMIDYAGGFTDNAYKERILIYRNTDKEKSVSDISTDGIKTFTLQSGDYFSVGPLLDRFTNRVQLNGAVFRPGVFALENGLTLSSIIKKADGLREDAFIERGMIYRLKEDNSIEVISFNVKDVLSGKGDILLKREDNIQIASKLELREGYSVIINGEVLKPGSYPYGDSMKVEDLIIAAGGLKTTASTTVEISRRITNSDPTSPTASVASIIRYEINKKDLKGSSEISLMPFDIVSVLSDPHYVTQRVITIEGEVLYPGSYSISNKKEKLSDIIKRAGGLTSEAFPAGAVLVRNVPETDADILIKGKKLETLNKQNQEKDAVAAGGLSKNKLVSVDLEKILKNSSKHDLIILDGDIIKIPKQQQTVQVSGEVQFPIKVRYDDGESFKHYISQGGGFTNNAHKRKSYIIYANGSGAKTKHFLFFSFYPKVQPGSEIIIPTYFKQERKGGLTVAELVTITTSLSTLGLMLIVLLPKL